MTSKLIYNSFSVDDLLDLCEDDYINKFILYEFNKKKLNKFLLKLPNEIVNIIKNYVIFKPKSNNELRYAANLWCTKKKKAFESKRKSFQAN